MYLEDAKRLIEKGRSFGSVYPLVRVADREPFKLWFISLDTDNYATAKRVSDDWRREAGEWGWLDQEPCRYCHEIGGVFFRADDFPQDRNQTQVVRCDKCGRNWECDSPLA